MARIDTLANFLEDVANKIRSKNGTNANITPANYDTEIEKIAYKPTRLIFGEMSTTAGQGGRVIQDATTTSIDFSNLDTSNVTSMVSAFQNMSALTTLDLSSFDTSNLIYMNYMFQDCRGLVSLNLSSFDTSNVTSVNGMFTRCSNLETINFGNNFSFENISSGLNNIFTACTKLDNNTLNQILHLCTTVGSGYTLNKTLAAIGIYDGFDNYANIPNLSNYQEFLDAGWTIS